MYNMCYMCYIRVCTAHVLPTNTLRVEQLSNYRNDCNYPHDKDFWTSEHFMIIVTRNNHQ